MKRLLSVVAAIALLSGSLFFSHTPDIGLNLRLFYAGFILASLGYAGLLYLGLPLQKKSWWAVFIILMLLPRLFALSLHPSDDIPRYIWEGRILAAGYNPYAIPPEDPRLAHFRDDVYPMINHKDMPAIYPPVTQYIFAALSLVTRRIEGYRLFILLMELFCIGVLFRWIKHLGLPRERILIYALNPLVIIGIAGQGHLDSLQIFLMILGLLVYSRGREGTGMILVTLSALVKFLGLFALPFMVKKRTMKFVPVCAGILFISYLPFFFLEGSFSFGNLRVYVGKFEYYSLTFAPLRAFFGTGGAQGVTLFVLLIVGISVWLTRTRPEFSVPPFLLLVTLMNTTVHFWYLTPLLALAVAWELRALIGLSLLFMPYFHVMKKFTMEGVWEGAWWLPVVTYVPFLFLLWLEMTGRWPSFKRRPWTVGAVIPVLNDAEPLDRLLASLSESDMRKEKIVIADGGSEDDSPGTARRWGARVISCSSRGRGHQIAKGVRSLDTDLIIILHADNTVPRHFRKVLLRTAAAYPHVNGGAFRLKYMTPTFKMKCLSILSNAKTALFGLSFGDQGQWIRRGKVEIPEMPLMEDVELAVRINDAGTSVWAPAAIQVSPRRYHQRGALKVIYSVFKCTVGYLLHRRWYDKTPDTRKLYEKYYGDPIGK